MAEDRKLQYQHNQSKKTQAYCDLAPPEPAAADTAHHSAGRQAPVRDEGEPEREDEPAVDCHGRGMQLIGY
jgi:hypothetical protein